jgi:hypothetical protein
MRVAIRVARVTPRSCARRLALRAASVRALCLGVVASQPLRVAASRCVAAEASPQVTQPARSFSAASAPREEERIGAPLSAPPPISLEPDFVDIRQQGQFYVDNTRFIELFEKHGGTKHVLFLRPPRFGKSTLISMMEAFYDCDLVDKEKRLQCFEGLYINDLVKQQQVKPCSRYVLSLDFSIGEDIDGSISTAFHDKVNETIAEFCDKYGFPGSEIVNPRNCTLTLKKLGAFLENMYRRDEATRKPLLILVDEYDRFANKLIASNREEYMRMVAKAGPEYGEPERFAASSKPSRR